MNRKAVLFLILLFVSSFAAIPNPSYSLSRENVRVYVDPSNVVDPNVLFNVSINVENSGGLMGAEWRLQWDPALLRVVGMTEVMFHEVLPEAEWGNIWRLANDVDNVLGIADYCHLFNWNAWGYGPIVGNHTMAILTFQVIGVGNCSLHITKSKLGNKDALTIVHETNDGFFSNSVTSPPIPADPINDSQLFFYITPQRVENNSLIINNTFSIALKMDTIATHHGIIAINFHLRWNATLLEFVSAEESMFHEVTPSNESDNIHGDAFGSLTGQLGYSAGFRNCTRATERGYAPVFGNHTVAIVTFKVKNNGTSLLHLDHCGATDTLASKIQYSSSDGFFEDWNYCDLNGEGVVASKEEDLIGVTTTNYLDASLPSIPEFPSLLVVALLMIGTVLAAIAYKKKHFKKRALLAFTPHQLTKN